MRRLAFTSMLLTIAAAIALAIGASAQGSDTYRFDVIFDDARGLVAGQLVKIAGAQAGTISGITVTHDYKARVQASVTGRFRFHTDASCTIRPQGLIAENYVECDPGNADAPLLAPQRGYPPTVPVTRTTEPVSLQDLFNIFNLPTRERFQVLVNELGIATAGRGSDINDILLRANPALGLARQVVSILTRQKAELAGIIDNTSTIAAEGAAHPQAIHNFITRAQALTQLTANHASPLSQAINRLPSLLGAAQPALSQLDTVARDGTPLLTNIRAAVPYLNRVNRDIIPFAAIASPALVNVNNAITAAIPSIHDTVPLVDAINHYVGRSAANTALFSKLTANLQQHGFVESFLSVLYYAASALARYDSTSHMLSILLVGPQNGTCGTYATTPVAGCSAHYGSQPAYTPSHRAGHATASRRGHAAVRPSSPAATTATHSPATATTPAPSTSSPAQGAAGTLQNLVNYLLR